MNPPKPMKPLYWTRIVTPVPPTGTIRQKCKVIGNKIAETQNNLEKDLKNEKEANENIVVAVTDDEQKPTSELGEFGIC